VSLDLPISGFLLLTITAISVFNTLKTKGSYHRTHSKRMYPAEDAKMCSALGVEKLAVDPFDIFKLLFCRTPEYLSNPGSLKFLCSLWEITHTNKWFRKVNDLLSA
jgi:hypothetical protein